MMRVAVAGCSGYAGGEVLRLLLGHPGVEIGALTAGASAGTPLGQHQPQLAPLADRVVEDTTPEILANHDAVIMALPHGASAGIAKNLPEDVIVIDCGADFRLADEAEWQHFYGTAYAGCWPYGVPELPGQREKLAGARRIAVPGCYPTAVALALAPGVPSGVIDGTDVVVVAASGTSGAGRALKSHLLGAEVMGSVSAYGVGGGHRHVPEMRQTLRTLGAESPTVSFTALLAPMSRGILATCTAPLARGADAGEAHAIWAQAYATEPFVRVLPAGQWPQTQHVYGSNVAHVGVTVDPAAGRVVVVAAIDNLVKGTAGAAVQCLNLASGIPEETGLPTIGVAP